MARLLIVEDNAELAALVESAVRTRGHTARTAGTGGAGLAAIDDEAPDLAIVDLLLPDVSGRDVLVRLKERSIPAIAVSGVYKGHRFAQETTQVLGARVFFEKPFEMRSLLDAVDRIAGVAQAPAEEEEDLEELEVLGPIEDDEEDQDEPLLPVAPEIPSEWGDEAGRARAEQAKPAEPEVPVVEALSVAQEIDSPTRIAPMPPDLLREATPVPGSSAPPEPARDEPLTPVAKVSPEALREEPLTPIAAVSPEALRGGSPAEPPAEEPITTVRNAAEQPPPSVAPAPQQAPEAEIQIEPPRAFTPARGISLFPPDEARADVPLPFARRDAVWKERKAARKARAATPDWSQAGALGTTSVPRLLTAYYQAGHRGELKLRNGQIVKVVYFEEGQPVYAASNVAAERFGRFCVRRGAVTEAQLAQVAEKAKGENLRTAEAMRALGLLAPERHAALLEDQVREIIWSTFGWKGGQYAFAPKRPARADLVKIRVFPGNLILEGVQRTETLVSLRQKVPAARRLYPTADPAYALNELKLSGAQALLVAYADGSKAVEDLLALTDLSEKEALATLLGFELLGVLQERREEDKRRRISFGL